MTPLIVSWADIGMTALIVAVGTAAILVGRLVLRVTKSLAGLIIWILIGLATIGGITVVVGEWIEAGGIPLK